MYATSVGLILKGREYLEENKTQLRFGEKKPEPETRREQSPYKQFKDEPVTTPEEVEVEDNSTRLTIGDRLKKLWEGIVEATDEKLPENSDQ
jgi:hypothetical protein